MYYKHMLVRNSYWYFLPTLLELICFQKILFFKLFKIYTFTLYNNNLMYLIGTLLMGTPFKFLELYKVI